MWTCTACSRVSLYRTYILQEQTACFLARNNDGVRVGARGFAIFNLTMNHGRTVVSSQSPQLTLYTMESQAREVAFVPDAELPKIELEQNDLEFLRQFVLRDELGNVGRIDRRIYDMVRESSAGSSEEYRPVVPNLQQVGLSAEELAEEERRKIFRSVSETLGFLDNSQRRDVETTLRSVNSESLTMVRALVLLSEKCGNTKAYATLGKLKEILSPKNEWFSDESEIWITEQILKKGNPCCVDMVGLMSVEKLLKAAYNRTARLEALAVDDSDHCLLMPDDVVVDQDLRKLACRRYNEVGKTEECVQLATEEGSTVRLNVKKMKKYLDRAQIPADDECTEYFVYPNYVIFALATRDSVRRDWQNILSRYLLLSATPRCTMEVIAGRIKWHQSVGGRAAREVMSVPEHPAIKGTNSPHTTASWWDTSTDELGFVDRVCTGDCEYIRDSFTL